MPHAGGANIPRGSRSPWSIPSSISFLTCVEEIRMMSYTILKTDPFSGQSHPMLTWLLGVAGCFSKCKLTWPTGRRHDNDASIEMKLGFVAAWAMEGAAPFRFFRIHQHAANAQGAHHLLCAGIELYGVLTEE